MPLSRHDYSRGAVGSLRVCAKERKGCFQIKLLGVLEIKMGMTYMLEKGVDNFEYIIMETLEEQREANKVKKKYIEEYKPRFNKEPCRVPRKRKENVEGDEKRPKYTYFYRGGRLFAVPIVYPDVELAPT